MATDVVILGATALEAAVDAVVDLADAGAGNADLVIFDADHVELARLAMSDPAFGASTGGVATADTITGAAADETGVASYFEVQDSDGTMVYTGSCGVTGSGEACTLNTLNIVDGVDVDVTSLTFTLPNT